MAKKKSLRLGIDRIIARSILWQILIALLLSSILIGIVGLIYNCNQEPKPFGKAFADIVSPVTLRSEAYRDSTQVVVADSAVATPTPHQERNLWGLGIIYFLGSLIFSGLLIATITNALRTRADRFKEGKMKYWFRSHVVIIGYNDLVPGMIQRLWEEEGRRPNRIVIGVNGNVQETFNQLRNHLEKNKKMVVVLNADSNNIYDLRKRLKVQHAKEVYIIGDGDDAYRMNSYKKIKEICGDKMPECYVEMRHQSTFALFQTYTEKKGYEHFHAFNFHNVWARQMMMREEIDTREGKSVGSDSDKQVHLVVIGMTEMGEALAREAAFLCHYPNYVTKGIRTKITFIDSNAKEQMTFLTGRYHHLFKLCRHLYRNFESGDYVSHIPKWDFLDLEFEFIQANVADEKMRNEISAWANNVKEVLTISVCTDMPHRSMAAGLYLPDEVFDNNIPVWVYQPAKGDMKEYLGNSYFKNVSTFGMSGKELNIKNEELIRQAKRLNHFYWHSDNPTYDANTIDEEWQGLTIYKKWSNLYNVSAIPAKMRAVDNDLEGNNEVISKVEHNRWNVEKLLMGFRPTTPAEHEEINPNGVRDIAKKKRYQNEKFAHDDIRPFDELDKATQNIDRNFTKEIPNIIKKA